MACVLVVDDEPGVRSLWVSNLTDAGYVVEAAEDGVQAILRVIEGGVDAVCLDIHMPHLDGVNALRILRQLAPTLPVIVAVVTGRGHRDDLLEALQLGARACLWGAIQSQTLLRVLQNILNGPSSEPVFESGDHLGSPTNPDA